MSVGGSHVLFVLEKIKVGLQKKHFSIILISVKGDNRNPVEELEAKAVAAVVYQDNAPGIAGYDPEVLNEDALARRVAVFLVEPG